MKRRWFDGIGTTFKLTLGTLDQSDALRYDEAIKTLRSEEDNIIKLLQQQTV